MEELTRFEAEVLRVEFVKMGVISKQTFITNQPHVLAAARSLHKKEYLFLPYDGTLATITQKGKEYLEVQLSLQSL